MTTLSSNSILYPAAFSELPLMLPVVHMTKSAFHTELKASPLGTRSAFLDPREDEDDIDFDDDDFDEDEDDFDEDDEEDEDEDEDDEDLYDDDDDRYYDIEDDE